MKVILKGGCWHGLKQLASLLLLLGLLVLSLTLLMPLANDYREAIAEKLSSVIHHPLKIGFIDIQWENLKLKPLVAFRDVEISDPDSGEPILHFAGMEVKINPWKSLLRRTLVADTISFSGSRLEIIRSPDNQLHVYGFTAAKTGKRPSLNSVLARFSGMMLELSDIRIVWDDQLGQRKYNFMTTRLDLYVGDDELALEAEVVPPRSVGDRLEVVLVAAGPLESPRNWDSHYFIQGRSINLAGVPYLREAVLSQADSGTLDIELWGSSFRDSGFDVQGSVALHDVRVNAPSTADAPSPARFSFIDELAADVHISGDFENWQLDMDRLRVITPQKHWPEGGLSIAYDHFADAYQGVIDYLDIESVRTIATLMPGLNNRQLEVMQRLQPVGELKEVDFSLPRDLQAVEKFSLKAQFDGLGWGEYDKLPGISGLSGQVLATAERGLASVDSTMLEVDYPRLFPEILDANALHADVSWERGAAAWNLAIDHIVLANGDFTAQGGARLLLGKGREYPNLTMEMIVPSVALDRVSHYIPYRIVPPKSGKWLREAFSRGHAENIRFSYSGPARKWAFKDGTAKMVAEFDVRDASLNYHDEWPALSGIAGVGHFANSHFSARVDRGSVLGAAIRKAQVEIKDLFRARLTVQGKATGKLPQALKFVQQSPLNRNLNGFLRKVTSSGDIGVDLDLLLTLSKKLKKVNRVKGVVDLKSCEAALPEQKVWINELQGQLTFTDKAFSADALTAVFRNALVNASVVTTEDQTIQVLMNGEWAPADLLPSQRALIEPVTRGKAAWHGVLNLPRRRSEVQQARSPWLTVTSDLVGVDIDLPYPLRKPSGYARKLFVEYHFSDKLPLLKIDYADLLEFSGVMQTQPEFTVRRGILALQQSVGKLPDTGITVKGRWPQVDISAWSGILSRYPTPQASDRRETVLDKVDHLDLVVDEVIVASQHFESSGIRASRKAGKWVAELDAPAINGGVEIPLPLGSRPVQARLERLLLQRGDDVRQASDFKPQTLPPLQVQSRLLQWGGLEFQNVSLVTRPLDSGLEISHLELNTQYLQTRITGHWLKSTAAESSDFSFAAQGKDVGKVLTALGHGGSLGSGSGTLTGDLAWQGAPAEFNTATLRGSLDIDLRDGWLKKVEPGLGRLLGLLSLDYLPRRLALNFKDMEQEGFFYDKLQGAATIDAGTLQTNGLMIDGPVATFEIRGTTSLVDRQYNLDLLVIPKLASTAPWAAGLIAGPQAGVAVFVLDKLAEGLGIDVNKTIALDYAVTGSWDDPKITALNQQEPDNLNDYLDLGSD